LERLCVDHLINRCSEAIRLTTVQKSKIGTRARTSIRINVVRTLVRS